MLNDVKFLYYLFTNYTLEEIRVLYTTIILLPEIYLKMIFKKFVKE